MRLSYLLALLIIVGLGAWLWSGDVIIGGQSDQFPPPGAANEEATKTQRVAVRTFTTRDRIAEIEARGRTEADERVDIRAQVAGLVEEIPLSKGSAINTGDMLCRIETAARKASLAQAEAQLTQAQLDYDGAVKLNQKGYAAETRVRALKAARDAAEAARVQAAWNVERTEVRAPITGRLENLPVDIGSYLKAGDVCATVVNADPMLVVVNISERVVGPLQAGMPAKVHMVDGRDAEGTIRYIAHTADTATRTFRVEVAVPNPSDLIREGMTADLIIPLAPVKAHLLPSSILVLADNGEIGVRAVGPDDTVQFLPVKILGDDAEGMWVAGLPETLDIIVVGQDYVKAGIRVEPVPAPSGATS